MTWDESWGHWFCGPNCHADFLKARKREAALNGQMAAVHEQYQADMTDKYGERVHHSANADYLLGIQNAHLQEEIKENIHLLLRGQITAQKACSNVIGQCK